MGFSVTGRVLNSLEGEGVPDATVYLNNQIKGNPTVYLNNQSKGTGPLNELPNQAGAWSISF